MGNAFIGFVDRRRTFEKNMIEHSVRTHKSAEDCPVAEHLAYKIAEVAADPVEVGQETKDMIINRIIDNAAVAVASVVRRAVTSARAIAAGHKVDDGGATVFGVDGTYSEIGRASCRERVWYTMACLSGRC